MFFCSFICSTAGSYRSTSDLCLVLVFLTVGVSFGSIHYFPSHGASIRATNIETKTTMDSTLFPNVICRLIQEYAKEELEIQRTIMRYVWKVEKTNRQLLPQAFQGLANRVYRGFFSPDPTISILHVRQAIRDLKQKGLMIVRDRLCVNRYLDWNTILETWVRGYKLISI